MIRRTEIASPCGTFRYRLERSWTDLLDEGRSVLFVMLNPSTADGSQDDPTVRRCMGFARRWGCSEMAVVNLFGRRATDPRDLWRCEGDLIGPENDRHVRQAAALTAVSGGRIVCAWGAGGLKRRGRTEAVLAILRNVTDEVTVLGWTGARSGCPRHPLYVPRSARGEAWRIGDEG